MPNKKGLSERCALKGLFYYLVSFCSERPAQLLKAAKPKRKKVKSSCCLETAGRTEQIAILQISH